MSTMATAAPPPQQQPRLGPTTTTISSGGGGGGPGGATEIVFKGVRFLVTERPTDFAMSSYLDDLKKFNVKVVVRVCESSYDTAKLTDNGIDVVDLSFPDGQAPSQQIIESWLDLARVRFSSDPQSTVAVHCVAGLGRAPVLVAIALMELGMKYEDAVELIRSKRRGAINAKQLSFLERYKPKSRLKGKLGSKDSSTSNCSVA